MKTAKPGDVLWGAVPYLPNGPLASDPPYQRGCVSGCVAHFAECQAMTRPSPTGVPVPSYCTTVPNTFGVFAECKAGEICDGVDNNLDKDRLIDEPSALVDVGVLDNAPPLPPGEDCPKDRIYYRDEDGDGWPKADFKCLCHAEPPYVLRYNDLFSNNSTKIDQHGNLLTDCCDTDGTTYPGATFRGTRDQCFSYDRDCDGIITPFYVASDSGCSSNVFSTSCGSPSGTYQYTTYPCGAYGDVNTWCSGAPGCHRQFESRQQLCK